MDYGNSKAQENPKVTLQVGGKRSRILGILSVLFPPF